MTGFSTGIQYAMQYSIYCTFYQKYVDFFQAQSIVNALRTAQNVPVEVACLSEYISRGIGGG